jgi:hypothetical protein
MLAVVQFPPRAGVWRARICNTETQNYWNKKKAEKLPLQQKTPRTKPQHWPSSRGQRTAQFGSGLPCAGLCLQDQLESSDIANWRRSARMGRSYSATGHNEVLNALRSAAMSDGERDTLATFIENDVGDTALATDIASVTAGIVARLVPVSQATKAGPFG